MTPHTKNLAAALALLSLTACDKTPENGALDGMWRLEEMHSRPAGSAAYSEPRDAATADVYWSFQLKLLDIKSNGTRPDATPAEVMARFTHTGGTLSVTSTYLHGRSTDTPVTADTQYNGQPIDLRPLGLDGCTATFRVVRLDSRRMTLCSDSDSLLFKKI